MGTIEDLKNPHPTAQQRSPEDESLEGEERPSGDADPKTSEEGEAHSAQGSDAHAPGADEHAEKTKSGASSPDRDRKPRVTVTPSDHGELERVAEKLRLSKAGVYNLAFSRLVDEMDVGV